LNDILNGSLKKLSGAICIGRQPLKIGSKMNYFARWVYKIDRIILDDNPVDLFQLDAGKSRKYKGLKINNPIQVMAISARFFKDRMCNRYDFFRFSRSQLPRE
jgi:hypothetical protein